MQIIQEYAYKIFSSRNSEELCDARFRFLQNSYSDVSERGRIGIRLEYEDPNISFGSNKDYMYAYNWEKGCGSHYSYYLMHIGDFILPHCLRREGLGLFIWSEIYNNLPRSVRTNLRISGRLSNVDAEVPLLDAKRRFVPDPDGPRRAIKLVNNIESRNRFWRKLLTHGPNGELVSFQCNENGIGAFSGWFKDPLLDKENHRPRVVRIP